MTQEQTMWLTVAGKQYRVVVGDVDASPVHVVVNGQEFWVDVDVENGQTAGAGDDCREAGVAAPPATRGAPAVSPAAPASAETEIIAPLPGVILDVRVQPGQMVAAGEVICYLEAMKMKNAIHAPHAGVIGEVAVGQGQTVEFGQVLVKYQ